MPLIACNECNSQISDKALWCPQCGHYDGKNPALNLAISDVQMPFSSIVRFMVKAVIATIPAALLLFFIVFLVSGFFTGLFTVTPH